MTTPITAILASLAKALIPLLGLSDGFHGQITIHLNFHNGSHDSSTIGFQATCKHRQDR